MKKKFLLVVLVASLVIAFVFLIVTNIDTIKKVKKEVAKNTFIKKIVTTEVLCYEKFSTKNSFPRFNYLKERSRLSSGRNIFFHETSCANTGGHARLNCRQACAVESAALMNPNMSVNLLILNHLPPSANTKQLVNQLLKYKNVRVGRILMSEYTLDTPMENWFSSSVLSKSKWPTSHMSDIMRYITLWKFSGIYLDLDIVVTKSLDNLTDFAGAEDKWNVAAGVLGFSNSEVGRRAANTCLHDLMNNFRGDLWGHNGPGVITRASQKFCAVQYAKDMFDTDCNGFKIYPSSVFYPIPFGNWKHYFNKEDFNKTMTLIENSKTAHLWNKFSSSTVVQVGSKVPYDLIAQKYCPLVYKNCGKTL